MINITVHHHHSQPHGFCQQQQQQQQQPVPSIRRLNKTSQLEVLYSGPQLASKLLLLETDANNNIENKRLEEGVGAPPTKTKRYSKTDEDIKPSNAGKQQQQLHTRSISLIVNPEFSSSSDSEADASANRRRPLPRLARRTRLLLATASEQQQTDSMDCKENSQPEVDQPSADQDRDQQQEPDADADTIETLKQLQAESCARLRETGAFLRQISDEFSKARRRTI